MIRQPNRGRRSESLDANSVMGVEGLRGKDSVGGKPRPEKDVSSTFSMWGAMISDWRWLWVDEE